MSESGPREASRASTVVRITHGRTYEVPIKVDIRQGSRLSPFLFIVVLDVISEEFRCGPPCELLFADDLAVVTYTAEEMSNYKFQPIFLSRTARGGRSIFPYNYSFNIVFSHVPTPYWAISNIIVIFLVRSVCCLYYTW